jgi:hypothetical protein
VHMILNIQDQKGDNERSYLIQMKPIRQNTVVMFKC